jgi:glutathione S-transferase
MSSQQKPKMKLHRHPLSGHSHRVELFLNILALPFEIIDVDMKSGEHKSAAFLSKNSFGQVPVLEDGDVRLTDSSAILVYLALKYDDGKWLPREPERAAAVQRWLSFAAGQIAAGPAAARLVNVFKAPIDQDRAIKSAESFLKLIDAELSNKRFAIGDEPTVADIACYTYIAHAPEGGVSLEAFTNLRNWLSRIEALPGFVPMKTTRVGLVA